MQWIDEKPWRGIALEIETNLSPREMMIRADIDRPLSKNKKLKSMANQKAVRFFKAFAEAGDARIEAFGNMESEPIMWVLAALNEDFTLPGGDAVRGCVLLFSKNEKRENVQAQFLTLRGAGNSTLHLPVKVRSTFRNTLLLSPMFDDEMTQKAKATIDAGRQAISVFASDAGRLAEHQVDDETANRYLFDVFQPGVSSQLPVIGEKEIEEQAEDKTRKAIAAFKNAPGQELESARMTAWGLLNAVTYTVDHLLLKNQDTRLRQAWFGFNATVKKRAFDLAIGLLKKD
ncbi:MAG: hypothetical protein NPINA01_05670 [Nitrospinaceae bacterium]|nr:MAG: hypothetical protein NPINA01_05670 [Nitrospinaceae bacterium]